MLALWLLHSMKLATAPLTTPAAAPVNTTLRATDEWRDVWRERRDEEGAILSGASYKTLRTFS